VSLLIAMVGAGGVCALFYIGPQRRKYNAEAGSTDADTASKLSGAALAQLEAAVRRAERAEAKADAAEVKADATEALLVRERDQRRGETSALRREIRDLRDVLARPAVAAAVAASGGLPARAELTHDDEGTPGV
jgi:hypothetical protein